MPDSSHVDLLADTVRQVRADSAWTLRISASLQRGDQAGEGPNQSDGGFGLGLYGLARSV